MRVPKYEAWIKSEGEMVDVVCIDFNEKYIISDTVFNEDYETGEGDVLFKFDDIELREWTGLKDKNGKEIYEGDVVNTAPWVKEKQERYFSKVEYYKDRINPFDYTEEYGHPAEKSEVIGNIYENPKLLKNEI